MGKLFAKLAAMGITPGLVTAEVEPSSDVVEELKREASSLRTKWALEGETTQELPLTKPEPPQVSSVPFIVIAEAPIREAWELPLAEWKVLRDQLRAAGKHVVLARIGGLTEFDYAHKAQVMKAMKSGKNVPEAVLRDYPDLRGT